MTNEFINPEQSLEDASYNNIRPQGFAEFIGQDQLKDNLSIY